MSTSLAKQLRSLETPQAESFTQNKSRASILFDSKQAALLDRQTVYEIGLDGYHTLLSFSSRLKVFEKHLFSESSKSFQRAVETRTVNDVIDDVISRFLIHICPYILLQSAHKALEWLIHRFQIHHYNTDDLLRCVLPVHDTPIFVRVVQILDLNTHASQWAWLQPVQKLATPLSRNVLANQCARHTRLLKFIIHSNRLVMQTLHDGGTAGERLCHVHVGFYTSLLSLIIRHSMTSHGPQSKRHSVDTSKHQRALNKRLAVILPRLIEGLSSKCSTTQTPSNASVNASVADNQTTLSHGVTIQPVDGVSEMFAASCMLIGLLVDRCQLDTPIIQQLVDVIIQNISEVNSHICVSTLSIICSSHQQAGTMSALLDRVDASKRDLISRALEHQQRIPHQQPCLALTNTVQESNAPEVSVQETCSRVTPTTHESESGDILQFLQYPDDMINHLEGLKNRIDKCSIDNLCKVAPSNVLVRLFCLAATTLYKDVPYNKYVTVSRQIIKCILDKVGSMNVGHSATARKHKKLKLEFRQRVLNQLLFLHNIHVHATCESSVNGVACTTHAGWLLSFSLSRRLFRCLVYDHSALLWFFEQDNGLDNLLSLSLLAALASPYLEIRQLVSDIIVHILNHLSVDLLSSSNQILVLFKHIHTGLQQIKLDYKILFSYIVSADVALLNYLSECVHRLHTDHTVLASFLLRIIAPAAHNISDVNLLKHFTDLQLTAIPSAEMNNTEQGKQTLTIAETMYLSSVLQLLRPSTALRLLDVERVRDIYLKLLGNNHMCCRLPTGCHANSSGCHDDSDRLLCYTSPQKLILKQTTKKFIICLSEKTFDYLATELLDIYVDSPNASFAENIHHILRRFRLNGSQVHRYLSKICNLSVDNSMTPKPIKIQKNKRKRSDSNSKQLNMAHDSSVVENSLKLDKKRIDKITVLFETTILAHLSPSSDDLQTSAQKLKRLLPAEYVCLTSQLFRLLHSSLCVTALTAEEEAAGRVTARDSASHEVAEDRVSRMNAFTQLLLSCIQRVVINVLTDWQSPPDGAVDSRDFNQCAIETLRRSIDVPTLIQCIRLQTSSTCVQKMSLVLLCRVSSLVPEVVTQNIMSVFTFMGSFTVREECEQSFQMVRQTLRSVIPSLLQVKGAQSYSHSLSINMMRVFVDALPHILAHRRLPLFSDLVCLLGGVTPASLSDSSVCDVTGVTQCVDGVGVRLGQCVQFLLIYLATHGDINVGQARASSDNLRQSLPEIIQFASSLCSKFSNNIQLASACFVTQYLQQLIDFVYIDASSVSLTTPDEELGENCRLSDLIQLKRLPARHALKLIVNAITFLQTHLTRDLLRVEKPKWGAPAKVEDHTHSEVRLEYLENIVHHCVAVVSALSLCQRPVSDKLAALSGGDGATSTGPSGLGAVLRKLYSLLKHITSLLSMSEFILVVLFLLDNDNLYVIRRGMETLSERLQMADDRTKVEDCKQLSADARCFVLDSCDKQNLLDILAKLISYLSLQSDTDNPMSQKLECCIDNVQIVNQQTALLTIKLMARNMAASTDIDYRNYFLKILKSCVLTLRWLSAGWQQHLSPLVASYLLCVADLIYVLAAYSIPHLSDLMSNLVQLFGSDWVDSDEILVVSVITVILKLTQSLSIFLSPYLVNILLYVCGVLCKFSAANTTSIGRKIHSHCQIILDHLGTSVEPRILFPVINDTLSAVYVTADHPSALISDNTSLIGNKPAISSVLELSPEKPRVISAILSPLVICLRSSNIVFINDQMTALQTVLFRLLDCRQWGYDSGGDVVETVFIALFVTLTPRLSELSFRPLFSAFCSSIQNLPGRFLTFYNILNALADTLKELFVLFAGNFFDNFCYCLVETNEQRASDLLFKDSKAYRCQLKVSLFQLTSKLCKHDSNGHFLTKARVISLQAPLIDQLEDCEDFDSDVTLSQSLLQSIVDLFSAVTDDSQLKSINSAINMKMRHHAHTVRLYATRTIASIHAHVADMYAAFLADTMPFLYELLEDENCQVEMASQQLIKNLQMSLGDSAVDL